jgi:hypothetical protein
MTFHLYEAQYFGGPCDGCVVIGTDRRGEETWSLLIATPDGLANSNGRSTRKTYRAVYKLSSACHLMHLGTPTIRSEYEFVGVEAVVPVANSVASPWLAFLTNRLRCFFQRSLWHPLPRERPKGLGQGAALTCPSAGFPGCSMRVARVDTKADSPSPQI